MSTVGIAIIVAVLVALVVLLLLVGATLFRKVGPNQALIVYGFGGTKVVKGSGKVVWPMVQQARELSLELMSFDVAPTQDLYTSQGVAVNVEAVAQIKVKSDPVSILTAAEQFLSKNEAEQQALIRLVMEGHLRGIVGQLTVEAIVKEPEMVADRMRSNVADDVSKMGLEVISFTIREVRDKNEYILNMGKPDIALVRRQADIATAEADRDTAIKRAHAFREATIAAAGAKQDEVIAQTASETKQAEATRDLNIKQAEYRATVMMQQAAADKAYEIQTNIQEQRAVEERVKIDQVRKHGEIAVQEAEILRREKELIATVLKAAEIERQRIEALADADRQRQILMATGQAEAERLGGQARAEVAKLQGLAEADVIAATGNAEARAMAIKADAYQSYNQAAIIDKLLSNLPETIRAMSEPLGKVDKITVVSTGGDGNGSGGGLGVSRVTSDMTQMIAQVPALLEALTGVKLEDLMRQVPELRGTTTVVNGHHGASGSTRARADARKPAVDGAADESPAE
ncbi:MAG TPA: SPFH domain-containing protein [Thermomicrobiales bacterium]|nr:SPFH domain-containing protein [Thermomicrobiales bacterium]